MKEEDEMVRTLRRRREAGGNDQPRRSDSEDDRLVTISSEIPCRVDNKLPRADVNWHVNPAHNGEALPARAGAAGNAVGSPLPLRGMTP